MGDNFDALKFVFRPKMPAEPFVRAAFRADRARQGHSLWQEELVTDVDQYSNEFIAWVEEEDTSYEVVLWLANEPQNIQSECDCGQELCRHAAALLYSLFEQLTATTDPTAADDEQLALAEQEEETLATLLAQLTVAKLRTIAKRHGWTLQGTLKDSLVDQLVAHLLPKYRQPDWFDNLSGAEHDLLAAVHTLYGTIPSIERQALLSAWQTLVASGRPAKPDQIQPIIDGLESYGVLFACRLHGGQDHYHHVLNIPGVQLPLYSLPAGLQPPPAAPFQQGRHSWREPATPLVEAIIQIGQTLAAGHTLRLRPLDWQAWSGDRSDPLQAMVGNWPTRADEVARLQQQTPFMLARGNQRLTVPLRPYLLSDESVAPLTQIVPQRDHLDWLVDLLLVGGMVKVGAGETIQLEETRWNNFLSQEVSAQWRALATIWQTKQADYGQVRQLIRPQPELSLWRVVHPSFTQEYLTGDLLSALQLTWRLLGSCLQSNGRRQWLDLDQFIRFIYRLRPEVYHVYSRPGAWGFQRQGKVVDTAQEKEWLATYGRMLTHLITGSLYWLGAVELRQQNGRTEAFRISEIGQWLLQPDSDLAAAVFVDEDTPGSATWLDEQTIRIEPGSQVAPLLRLLREIGAPAGPPLTSRIGGAGLENFLARGNGWPEIEQSFSEAQTPLPEAGRQHIQTLTDRYGQVQLYDKLSVIEFADDLALAELRNSSGLFQKALIYELNPRLVVIDGHLALELQQELVKKGYTPGLTEGLAETESHEA